MTKWIAGVLISLVVLLQYRIWLSDDGVREAYRLRQAVDQQVSTNSELKRRNEQLAAEVADLKSGMTAIEERARSELGMVAPGESFYQVVPKMAVIPATPAAPAKAPAAPAAAPVAPAPAATAAQPVTAAVAAPVGVATTRTAQR